MTNNKARKIIVAIAPVGKEVELPAINPLTPQEVAKEVIDCTRMDVDLI